MIQIYSPRSLLLKNSQLSFSIVRSVVSCRCRCSSRKLFLLLQNNRVNFNLTWQKASLGKGDSCFLNKGPRPFPRADNNRRRKIYRRNLKILSRTTGLSTKLDTEHSWVKKIQVYSNKATHPFPTEDNNEIEGERPFTNFKKSPSPESLG